MKFQIVAECTFKSDLKDKVKFVTPIFFIRSKTVHNESEILKQVESAISDIIEKFISFSAEGSDWVFVRMEVFINISFIKPLSGSSYVQLPEKIRNKRAVLNIQNKDNKCFQF